QDGRCTSYTENGASCTGVAARPRIHSSSVHSWCEAVTTDAVFGGSSASRAIGSAFRKRCPCREWISNLYRVPSPTLGRNSSHTPVEPSERIGKVVPSQCVKSAARRTPWALG